MSFTDYIYVTSSEPEKQFAGRAECVFDAQKDGQIEYSKQAFSKGRKRIKPEAFQELFQSVVDSFYEKPNWLTGKATNCLGSMVPG
ncbi:MAG: hypothetical protein ACLS3C_00045 [Oscillospiraceae bacterium]